MTVTAKDNGGTANGGIDTSAPQTFTISLTPVNDAPSFTKGADQTTTDESSAQTVTSWATNVSSGMLTGSGYPLTFHVSADHPEYFSVEPAIAANGTLTYTPKANAHGTATVPGRLARGYRAADSGTGSDLAAALKS